MDSNMLFPIQQHLSSALGICDSLRITDRFVTEYVTSFAPNLLPRLETAPEFGDVSNVFME